MNIINVKRYRIKKVRKVKKIHYIKIGAEIVAVTWKVYYAYMRPVWREAKRAAVRMEKEISYDLMLENGSDLEYENQKMVDDIAVTNVLIEKLRRVLPKLTDEDRFWINELYFKYNSERAVGRAYSIPRKTISYRMRKIIEKIKNFL